MPGFPTWADLRTAKRDGDRFLEHFHKIGPTTTTLAIQSQWAVGSLPAAGAQPVNGVSYTSAAGGVVFPDTGAVKKFLSRIECHCGGSQPFNMVIDRLSAYGGIAATGLGAKVIATPALPRYTSAHGVQAAIEVQSQLLAATRTVSVTYTNEAGTPGRTSGNVLLPTSAGVGLTGSIFHLPLQAPDLGVRSVEALNVVAETGGGTSTVNVVLFKQLVAFAAPQQGTISPGQMRWVSKVDYLAERAAFVQIMDGATISFITQGPVGGGVNSAEIRGYIECIYR